MTQSPKKSGSSFRPRIKEFPGGLWRLLWLGGVRESKTSDNPVGYDVQVHLGWGGSGDKPPQSVWTPLTHLIYLRPQSLWENQVFREHPPGGQLDFQVDAASAVLQPPWQPGPPSGDLLQRGDYHFQKLRDLAPCWVLDTVAGQQLIVPAWEVLRAWYLFDHSVMPAVLAGAIRQVDTLPRAQQPWLPGTGARLISGHYQYVRPHWMSQEHALRMARLVFEDGAFAQAYDIYRQLMVAKSRAGTAAPTLPMPAVRPPFNVTTKWTVKCKAISNSANGRQRFLVLSLDHVQAPNPFDEIFMRGERDQGLNHDDPNLPRYVRQGKAPIDLNTPPELTLVGAAPDPALQSARIEGFDFHDDIVESVRVIRDQKVEQVSRFTHTPSDPVIIAGGATDPAAPMRRKHARVETGGAYPPLSADDLLHQTLDAFRLIIAKAGADGEKPVSLRAQLITRDGGDTFPVRSVKTKQVRHFAILQVSIGAYTAYALEAQRLLKSEEFSLCLCRSTDSIPMAQSLLEIWLNRFPAKRGSPWAGNHILPRNLVTDPKRVLHQQRDKDATPIAVTGLLAKRIEERVRLFLLS